MADTYTPHYNLTKPQVGGDPDTWGDLLNGNFDIIDAQMKANYDLANAALPTSGGTMTGALNGTSASFSGTIVSGSSSGLLQVGSSSGNFAQIRYDGSLSVNGGAFNTIATFGSSPTFAFVTAPRVDSGNNGLILSAINGTIYLRPNGTNSETGQAYISSYGTLKINTTQPVPSNPNAFALHASGAYGGGLYLDDVGGTTGFGIYVSGSNLIIGTGSNNGGSLSQIAYLDNSGVLHVHDVAADL